MTARREARDQRRQALLAGVMATFAARGFQGAGVAEIAAACGVAPANLYRYFPSKEAMVQAIVRAQRQAVTAQLLASRAQGSARAVLRHFMREVTAQASTAPMRALWLEILAEAARNPAIAAILREDDSHLTAAFAGLVAEGMAAGEVRPDRPADAVARLLIALMDGAMARAAYDPGFALGPFMADAEAMLFQGAGR